MPPSSVSLDSSRLLANERRGVRTLLPASWGSLYNVHIDFSLGITDDTSASGQREEGATSFIPTAHNKLRMCVGVCLREKDTFRESRQHAGVHVCAHLLNMHVKH